MWSNDLRIDLVRMGFWISTAHTQRIHGKLEYLVSHPQKSYMPNLIVVGHSGSGKTRLIEEFLSLHPASENAEQERSRIPVVYCEVPADPDLGGFYNQILVSMGAEPSRERVDARRRRVEDTLGLVEAKLLIFDESQHVLNAGPHLRRILASSIKSLSNQVKISIVLVGTREALTLLRLDPQIDRRFERDEIALWTLNQEWRRLLVTFERRLPLRKASRLSDQDVARTLHRRSSGTIGRLARTLSEAAVMAIEDGTERITPEILDRVTTSGEDAE